jgi:transglutaminase-like putative cysteine protease
LVIHHAGLPDSTEGHLAETFFHDFRAPRVQQFVADAIGEAVTPRERAVRLFYAVRDRIRYDPYRIAWSDDDYTASSVLEKGYGWCIPKAVLLSACVRAVGIPSAIGLADVVNHLTTDKLRERMGGVDVFYDHGYTALHLDGRWVKAVPAFNIELCTRFGVHPTEFDGTADALYQEYDLNNRLHMQYLADHGTWSDLPMAKIRDDFAKHYPGSLMSRRARIDDSVRFENDR